MNAVTALRIYNGGNNGCTPMADILHVDGTIDKAVRWDVIDNREKYDPFITAYTYIYDDRPKPDIRSRFPEFYNSNFKEVVSRININDIRSGSYYLIDLMSMRMDGRMAMYDVYDLDMNMIGIYGAYCFKEVFNNEE